jgi:hypothetical protein
MIAIETRYLGPTDKRGSRYVATTCNGHRLMRSADDSLNAEGNQAVLARALADQMKWNGELIGGGTKLGMCWVFADSSDRA